MKNKLFAFDEVLEQNKNATMEIKVQHYDFPLPALHLFVEISDNLKTDIGYTRHLFISNINSNKYTEISLEGLEFKDIDEVLKRLGSEFFKEQVSYKEYKKRGRK